MTFAAANRLGRAGGVGRREEVALRRRVRPAVRTGLALTIAAVAVMIARQALAQAPSGTCGSCHTTEQRGYALSAHASAAESGAFQALAREASAVPEWGQNGCLRCHAPAAGAAVGVSCEACHLMESAGRLGYGDFRLATDGAMRSANPGQAPHPTSVSPLFGDSLFCAACHEQYHPKSGVALQATYTEWLNSGASRDGQACQACHMAGAWSSHAFGAGARDDATKDAALAQAIALEVRWPDAARAGAPFVVDARLENTGAGHALPTGKPEGYEMWLELAAAVDGRTIFTETLPFGVVFADRAGKYQPPVSSVDAASLFRDHRLFPGRLVAERFVFVIPSDARGSVDVEVQLMYRRTPRWLSERLGLPDALAVVVHRASASLPVVEPPPRPTYVAPTPTATPTPTPVPAGGPEGAGVKAEEQGWLGPFFLVSALLLMAVMGWALRKRAI